MNAATFAKYKKAIGGFLATLVGLGGAVLALGVLSGPASHNLAVALTIATPFLTLFGVAVTPANQPPTAVQTASDDLVASVKKLTADYHAMIAAVQAPPVTPVPPAPVPPVAPPSTP
jgi:hypothetical protein